MAFRIERGHAIASGVGVKLKTNVDQVLSELDGFVDDVLQVAAPRALNKLRDQAKTAGFRKLAELYDIGPRTMDKYATLTFAKPGDLEATINVKGKGFPLAVFKPRQTALGVSIQIKGGRTIIPHSFLAKMPSGHVGVFARGTYGASFRFSKGRARRVRRGRWTELPIRELFTFGPAKAFANPDVVDAMQSRVDEQAGKVLKQEIRFAARG